MNLKIASLIVAAVTVVLNLIFVYLGFPQTITCSIAQLFGTPAVATTTQ